MVQELKGNRQCPICLGTRNGRTQNGFCSCPKGKILAIPTDLIEFPVGHGIGEEFEKMLGERWERIQKVLIKHITNNTDRDWVIAEIMLAAMSAREMTKLELNDCVCKEKYTLGVVHLKDAPCYWPKR